MMMPIFQPILSAEFVFPNPSTPPQRNPTFSEPAYFFRIICGHTSKARIRHGFAATQSEEERVPHPLRVSRDAKRKECPIPSELGQAAARWVGRRSSLGVRRLTAAFVFVFLVATIVQQKQRNKGGGKAPPSQRGYRPGYLATESSP